jgi:hypothetical protein
VTEGGGAEGGGAGALVGGGGAAGGSTCASIASGLQTHTHTHTHVGLTARSYAWCCGGCSGVRSEGVGC